MNYFPFTFFCNSCSCLSVSFFARSSARGYVAVISAIILSVILTALVFAESASTFWSRYDQLAKEAHEKSFLLAESCAYESLLQYAENPTFYSPAPSTIESLTLDSGTCTTAGSISSNAVSSSSITFLNSANIQNTYAAVGVSGTPSLTSGILSITSWRDITSIPP